MTTDQQLVNDFEKLALDMTPLFFHGVVKQKVQSLAADPTFIYKLRQCCNKHGTTTTKN